jgi:serine protease Do
MSRTVVVLPLLALWSFAQGALAPSLTHAEPPGPAAAFQDAVQQVIERAEPSVACILVSRSDAYGPPASKGTGKLGTFSSRDELHKLLGPPPRRRFGPAREQDWKKQKDVEALDLSLPDTVPESFGSGVVIDEAGLILTNAHVVRDATKVYVRLPGKGGSWADIHALDPRSDLAVLKLIDPPAGLQRIKFGDGDKVKKGQFVVSLANPFAAGFRDGSSSASLGIVSSLKRRAPGNPNEVERSRQSIHQFGTLLQTDVKVALGCSGGALLNLDGELIGLTTATAALSGTETPGGYALPMDAGLRRVIEVLARGEEVEYGFLGVQMDPEPAPNITGVVINGTPLGMPAANAGLQQGDVIVAVDGKQIKDNDDLFVLVGLGLAGHTVQVDVARRGQLMTFNKVELAKFYVPGPVIASKRPPAPGGLRVDYRSILMQQPMGPFGMRIFPDSGVVIREVVAKSSADDVHLQKDKIITHVNGREIHAPKDFYAEMARAGKDVELTVIGFDGAQDRVKIENKE